MSPEEPPAVSTMQQAEIRHLVDENPDRWFDLRIQRQGRPLLFITVRGCDVPWCVSFLFRPTEAQPPELAIQLLPACADDWTAAQRTRAEAWRTLERIQA